METLYRTEEGLAVGLIRSSFETEALIEIFAQVAEEQAWEPGNQLCAHRDRSRYFAALVGDTLAGGLQLVLPDRQQKLPCHLVWPELRLHEQSQIAEVALLALQKAYRAKSNCLWLLFVEMWRYCRCHEIEKLWSEITPANLRRYQRLRLPLHIAGPLRPHWGEDCYPCRVSVQELENVFVERAIRSPLHRQLVAQAFREPFPSILNVAPEVSV